MSTELVTTTDNQIQQYLNWSPVDFIRGKEDYTGSGTLSANARLLWQSMMFDYKYFKASHPKHSILCLFKTIDRLAEDMNWSRSTCQRALNELRDGGYLHQEHRLNGVQYWIPVHPMDRDYTKTIEIINKLRAVKGKAEAELIDTTLYLESKVERRLPARKVKKLKQKAELKPVVIDVKPEPNEAVLKMLFEAEYEDSTFHGLDTENRLVLVDTETVSKWKEEHAKMLYEKFGYAVSAPLS